MVLDSSFVVVAGTAFVIGILIGSFLNVVVWRVPRGESLLPGSRCPNCDAPIRPLHNVPVISWLALRGNCADCGARIRVRYPLVEFGTAVAFAAVAWWVTTAFGWPTGSTAEVLAWWLTLAAHLWFAAASIALALVDIEHRRLPDRIVLPSLAVVLLTLALAAVFAGDWGRLVSTVGGAAVLFVLYFLIALVYPRGMGGGDVKLAPLVGAVLGFAGWDALAVGAFAGFLLGALWGVGLMLRGRGGRKSQIPFGPFMLAGAWVGAVWGNSVWNAYLHLVGLG